MMHAMCMKDTWWSMTSMATRQIKYQGSKLSIVNLIVK